MACCGELVVFPKIICLGGDIVLTLPELKSKLLSKMKKDPSYKGHKSIVRKGGFTSSVSALLFEFPLLSDSSTWKYLHEEGFTISPLPSSKGATIQVQINYSFQRASSCNGGKVSSSWGKIFGKAKPVILL